MARFWTLVFLVTITVISPIRAASSDIPSAVFYDNSTALSFAINIPSDRAEDIYFSISAPKSRSWVGIGLGKSVMKEALMLLIYTSATGSNVTLSPRYASGASEPQFWPNISVATLQGTGVYQNGASEMMTYVGRCGNCRKWSTGYIDIASQNASFIFAAGPQGTLNTNNVEASLKFHVNYGVFEMDLKSATGIGGAPTAGSSLKGAKLVEEHRSADWVTPLHGALMIVVAFGTAPLSLLIISTIARPVKHAWINGFSTLIAVVGLGIGVYLSKLYNRTRSIRTPHQIIGFIVTCLTVIALLLGFTAKRSQESHGNPNKMILAYSGVLACLVLLGIIDAFLGFTLSFNPHLNYILAGLTALLVLLNAAAYLITRRKKPQRS